MDFRILLAVTLALLVASCGPGPISKPRSSSDVKSRQSHANRATTRFVALPASSPPCAAADIAAAVIAPVDGDRFAVSVDAVEPFDEKEDNGRIRKTRYSNVEYQWGKWKLLDVHDSEHRYSHVRIEFDGVLQFLSTGFSGYTLGFFDSDDFAGENFEDSAPPPSDQTRVWLSAKGERTNLVVEDLTGSSGATLVLHENTGGNHVFRITTFIHLTVGGEIVMYGPYRTSMEPTHSVKGEDDVVFEMNDNCWQGWNSCQAGSAHPVIRLSLKGGTVHSCNGQLSTSEVSMIMASMTDDSNHADICSFMALLELIYHGRINEAHRYVRESPGPIGGCCWPEVADFPARAAWWRDLIRQLRTSTFYDLLEKEFPQLKDADELK